MPSNAFSGSVGDQYDFYGIEVTKAPNREVKLATHNPRGRQSCWTLTFEEANQLLLDLGKVVAEQA